MGLGRNLGLGGMGLRAGCAVDEGPSRVSCMSGL